jgi:chemotaxis protein CheX
MDDTILLIDCSTELTQTVSRLLEDKVIVQNEAFEETDSISNYRMVILEAGKNHEEILQKIRQLRYACKFRNVPVVLIKNRGNHTPIKHYITAGATEVLSLDDPIPACRQILQGCLIPGRQALVEEKEYLTPFIQSTQSVLEKMASVNAKFQEVYFSNDFRIFGEISGIIGLSGMAEGTVVITFYWDFARTIIAQMMDVQEDEITAEYIHDGAGEIVNMISGVAKKSFVGRPYHFELSLPTVVVGSGHQIGHPEEASIAVMVFDVDTHSFALQVCLKPKKNE